MSNDFRKWMNIISEGEVVPFGKKPPLSPLMQAMREDPPIEHESIEVVERHWHQPTIQIVWNDHGFVANITKETVLALMRLADNQSVVVEDLLTTSYKREKKTHNDYKYKITRKGATFVFQPSYWSTEMGGERTQKFVASEYSVPRYDLATSTQKLKTYRSSYKIKDLPLKQPVIPFTSE